MHAMDVGLSQLVTLSYTGRRGDARLTVVKLPDNQFYSVRTVGT